MMAKVKRVPGYHPQNSNSFYVGDYKNAPCTLSDAFDTIIKLYDNIVLMAGVVGDFENVICPAGFTENKEYYSHICSFITGEILFFVKVKPDRSVQFLTTQQALAGIGFDS